MASSRPWGASDPWPCRAISPIHWLLVAELSKRGLTIDLPPVEQRLSGDDGDDPARLPTGPAPRLRGAGS